MATKKELIKQTCGNNFNLKQESQEFFAPTNIALIKYWGKSDFELNLPATPSVSITSKNLGTKTKIIQSNTDKCFVGGVEIAVETSFYKRVFDFINLFRDALGVKQKFAVYTSNNFPTASGLASSASGFCALVLAINDVFGLKLENDRQKLATLARLGSGSACRSVFGGECKYVTWENDIVKPVIFPDGDFRNNIEVLVLVLSNREKKTSSREAMVLTQQKSVLYQQWLLQTQEDYKKFYTAKFFEEFGEVCESNSLFLHRAINEVGIDYFNNRTREMIDFIQKQRTQRNLPVYLTIDAGANVCVFFEKKNYQKVLQTLLLSGLVVADEVVWL